MQIRPVSDLRNKFPEVEKCVECGEPVYLTKNGYGSMVVVSLDEYDRLTRRAELFSEFEILVGEAKSLLHAHLDAQQVVVVRTTKNRIRSYVYHSMSEIIEEDNAFVRELIEKDDAEIKHIVCMWDQYAIDLPSIQLRKRLLEVSPVNGMAEMILQGEYDFSVRTIISTMGPTKV